MEYAQIVKLLLHCSVVGVAWCQSVCAIIPTPCHSLTMTAMKLARAQKDLGPGYSGSQATKLYDFRFGQMAQRAINFFSYCVFTWKRNYNFFLSRKVLFFCNLLFYNFSQNYF